MSSSEAELTLVMRARNLADAAVGTFTSSVAKVGDVADTAARKVGQAFDNATNAVSNAIGNLTENLLQGGDIGQSFLLFGTYLAGQMAEELIGQLLERVAGSTLVAEIGGALSAAGTAIGGLLDTAIGIGMAALPFVLLAALVAAIAFLVTHPDVAAEIANVAGGILHGIVDGLAGLAGAILGAVVAAPGVVADVVGGFVGTIVAWYLGIPGKLLELGASIVRTIIDGMIGFPGAVADVVRRAFAGLRIDVGPFHITGQGVTIDLPNIAYPAGTQAIPVPHIGGHAAGGWVGMNGPELSWVGEQGPEYIVPNSALRSSAGGAAVRLVGVSIDQLAELIDQQLYFRLQRAAPTEDS